MREETKDRKSKKWGVFVVSRAVLKGALSGGSRSGRSLAEREPRHGATLASRLRFFFSRCDTTQVVQSTKRHPLGDGVVMRK